MLLQQIEACVSTDVEGKVVFVSRNDGNALALSPYRVVQWGQKDQHIEQVLIPVEEADFCGFPIVGGVPLQLSMIFPNLTVTHFLTLLRFYVSVRKRILKEYQG